MHRHEYYCDHCGARLNEMTDYLDEAVEFAGDEIDVDLCRTCQQELLELIETYVNYEKTMPTKTK